MERVIGQLVNCATIFGGRLSLEPEHVAVRGVIDDAVRRWRKRVTDAHEIVRRVPAGTPAVEADRTYPTQVLDELIDNAVKYSPAGGRITVSAAVEPGADPDAAATLPLSVADRGFGHPAERRSPILDRWEDGRVGKAG